MQIAHFVVRDAGQLTRYAVNPAVISTVKEVPERPLIPRPFPVTEVWLTDGTLLNVEATYEEALNQLI